MEDIDMQSNVGGSSYKESLYMNFLINSEEEVGMFAKG